MAKHFAGLSQHTTTKKNNTTKLCTIHDGDTEFEELTGVEVEKYRDKCYSTKFSSTARTSSRQYPKRAVGWYAYAIEQLELTKAHSVFLVTAKRNFHRGMN